MLPAGRGDRLRAVQHVLYLVVNEGYLASSGPEVQRGELATEGIRRSAAGRAVPEDGEAVGLVALMLLLGSSGRARRPGGDGVGEDDEVG